LASIMPVLLGDGLQKSSEGDRDWVQGLRKAVKMRSWYPDSLAAVLWLAMQMPGPPSDLVKSLCSRNSLSCELATSSPSEWQRALANLPEDAPRDLVCVEALRSEIAGLTTAQLLTTTQENYAELWTEMGWPCRRKAHDRVKAVRALWKAEYGMQLCNSLMQHVMG